MLRSLLLSVAFTAAFLPATSQNRETSALSASDIASMTWVEAMQDYRVNFHTVVDKFNACQTVVNFCHDNEASRHTYRRTRHVFAEILSD